MRLDRLATLYLAHPIRKLAPVSDNGCVRILMYHRISDAPEPNVGPYFRVNTSPARFAEQMRLLHEERYKVIDLLQAIALLQANAFSRKHVVITFDDGYADFREHAYPVLKQYNFTATVFLPTSFITDQPATFKGSDCLTWSDVKTLRAEGIRFGSHTVSHPKLRDLGWKEIESELSASKAQIEDRLQESITTFAYPYAYPEMDASFVERFSNLLGKVGYACCVTTRIGLARSGDDLRTLKRLPVNDGDDPSFFRAKLDGSYDCVAKFRQVPTTQHLPLERAQMQFTPPQRKYVLVTPAKNEAATLPETIASVTKQTLLPSRWVIVSDGSTDQTNDLVRAAQVQFNWIKLLELPPRVQRSFASVVHATEAGVQALESVEYEYIGLLDADLHFQRDYFERLIIEFEREPELGLAGGMVVDLGDSKSRIPRKREDVPGATQFFRRECFHSLGAILAIPEGGWDGLTCARARMSGFRTRLCTNLVVDHLKPRNISEGNLLQRKWKMGIRDFSAGYHPVFELVKCVSRISDRPFLIGSIAWWCGYSYAGLRGRPRILPADLLSFIQAEQKQRLRSMFSVFRRPIVKQYPLERRSTIQSESPQGLS